VSDPQGGPMRARMTRWDRRPEQRLERGFMAALGLRLWRPSPLVRRPRPQARGWWRWK
jgi:hypothetical protein